MYFQNASFRRILIAIFSLLFWFPVKSQSIAECRHVLIPTVQRNSTDVRSIYSYVYENAYEEWDRLNKMSAEQRAAEATYKFFSGEYHDSKNSREFSDKTRTSIEGKKVFVDSQEAFKFYRRGVEPGQVDAWSRCVESISGAGNLEIFSRNEGSEDIAVLVNWAEPKGERGEREISFDATNGKIFSDGRWHSHIKKKFSSTGTFTIVVKRDTPTSETRVIANTPGFSDDLLFTKSVSPIRICTRYEKCEGEPIACLPTLIEEPGAVLPGRWVQAPSSPRYDPRAGDGNPTTPGIRFGPFTNQECNASGSGWAARIGTCGKGTSMQPNPMGWQSCQLVEVRTKRK